MGIDVFIRILGMISRIFNIDRRTNGLVHRVFMTSHGPAIVTTIIGLSISSRKSIKIVVKQHVGG